MTPDLISRFARLILQNRRITALTGAGISTASGIPDFRSNNGIYSDERNANVFDIAAFVEDPSGYYCFAREFDPLVRAAQPNAAHLELARWEAAGWDVRIATQNIDDLHQRAGSRRVYPVHGTMQTSTCRACRKQVASAALAPVVVAGEIPHCPCGGVFKPDVTFFGEALPEAAWAAAVEAMHQAELVLILGTSLVVFPAAGLPRYRAPGAALVIVNREPTELDEEADLVLHADLPGVFTAVKEQLSTSNP